MSHLSYEEGKKVVLKGLIILGIVTLLEVGVALLGKGYLVHGFHLPRSIMYTLMISMSLYKAYFIVYEFMHMRYEAPGLVRTVLMPTMLLIWAVIAFFYEGTTWHHNRLRVNDHEIAKFSAPTPSEHHGGEMQGSELKTGSESHSNENSAPEKAAEKETKIEKEGEHK